MGIYLREWKIPFDVLSAHSNYFRDIPKRKSGEATVERVELQDEKPAAFELIVEWINDQTLGANFLYEYEEDQRIRIGRLLDMYLLAEFLQMPKLQNAIIRDMSDQLTETEYAPVKKFERVCDSMMRIGPLYNWMGESGVWISVRDESFYDECACESAVQLLINVCNTMRYKSELIREDKCPVGRLSLVEEPRVRQKHRKEKRQ